MTDELKTIREAWEWEIKIGDEWVEVGADNAAEARHAGVDVRRVAQQAEAVPQSIARKFESMHARGDVWITTLAAAAIAAQGEKP